MKILPIITIVGTSSLLALTGCEVEQTREGKMPEVDVSASPGQMPKYDVDTAEVKVGTKEETVKVPDVDVSMEKQNIQVPTIGVKMPDEKEGEATPAPYPNP